MRIAVCGSTGQTGHRIVAALAAQGATVTALTRTADNSESVRTAGAADIAVADPRDMKAMTAALAGHSAVYIIPPTFVSDEADIAAIAARAAAAAGVTRVVLHSVLHPNTSTLRHHLRKSAAEEAIRNYGVEWVILQPAMYAQTVLMYHAISPAGQLLSPWNPDSRFSVIDVGDVARIAARAVTDPSMAYGTFELAGPERLSMNEMAAQLSTSDGEAIRARTVALNELPLPPWTLEMLADFICMCADYDRHGLVASPLVAQMLLGAAPTRFADAARTTAAIS